MKSKVTLIDCVPMTLPSGQRAILPVPEKKAQERIRKGPLKARVNSGGGMANVCDVCKAKEGMPHPRTGKFVKLIKFQPMGLGPVWCCQECAKFGDSRGYKRA